MEAPTRSVIAGVEVDALYSDGTQSLPAGTLTTAWVRLVDETRSGDHAIVGVSQVDPVTGAPLRWWVGLNPSGWIADISWPTIEAAVTAVRNPSVVKKLRALDRLARSAAAAEEAARQRRNDFDLFLAKLNADLGVV